MDAFVCLLKFCLLTLFILSTQHNVVKEHLLGGKTLEKGYAGSKSKEKFEDWEHYLDGKTL